MSDTLRAKAHAIAWDDCASETNGYLSWENLHSCGGYGCCGGGKDIDRQALERVIYEALVEAQAVNAGATPRDEGVTESAQDSSASPSAGVVGEP